MKEKIVFKDYLQENLDSPQVILQHGTNSQPNLRYMDFLGVDNLIFAEFPNEPSAQEVLEHQFRVVDREHADWIMCRIDGHNGKAMLDDTAVWCTW